MSNRTIIHGYECPANTSLLARIVLRDLKDYCIAVFVHDDGPSYWVRQELEIIAYNLGLEVYKTNYKLVILDEWNFVDGTSFSEKYCKKLN